MNVPRPSTLQSLLLISVLLTGAVLAGCAPGNSEPTIAPEAIFTSAFETFSAQLATKQAAATPTFTPLPLPSPLPSPLPTLSILVTQPGLAFSSPTAGGALPAGGDCENRSKWIADVTVPDNTVFTPGQDFKKTWRVQNTGTCTWDPKYTVQFKDGLQMAGTQAFMPISVPPGQQVDISVDLEAPKDIGSFYGRWVLAAPDGKFFGSYLTVVLKVEGTAQ